MVLIVGAVLTIAVVGIVLSSCQEEVGIVEPSPGTVAAVARVAEAHEVLDERASYEQYSDAFRVALHRYDGLVLHNAADSNVRAALLPSVECMKIAREAWQAAEDGAWDAETQGSAEYWQALRPSAGIELGEGELDAEEVLDAANRCAQQGLAEATEMVGE
jgi:hypothetical protein